MTNPDFKADPGKNCSAMVNQLTGMSDSAFAAMQQKGIGRLLADTSKQPMLVRWSVASDRKTFGRMYCNLSAA